MHRRVLLAAIGGSAVLHCARAQQQGVPLVGYLESAAPDSDLAAAFRKGLSQMGFLEGRNVAIEYRRVQGRSDLALAELVRRRVAVIAVPYATSLAIEAKNLTTTIPIVFATGADPVQLGLVESLNRPGGNVTGLTNMSVELGAKRFGLLRELAPNAARVGAFINPTSALAEFQTKEAQAAASMIRWPIEIFHASNSRELDAMRRYMCGQRRPQVCSLQWRHEGSKRCSSQTYSLF
jgi:putative ABC transport system substrate-binding protein